jgi:hypothetical protein
MESNSVGGSIANPMLGRSIGNPMLGRSIGNPMLGGSKGNPMLGRSIQPGDIRLLGLANINKYSIDGTKRLFYRTGTMIMEYNTKRKYIGILMVGRNIGILIQCLEEA